MIGHVGLEIEEFLPRSIALRRSLSLGILRSLVDKEAASIGRERLLRVADHSSVSRPRAHAAHLFQLGLVQLLNALPSVFSLAAAIALLTHTQIVCLFVNGRFAVSQEFHQGTLLVNALLEDAPTPGKAERAFLLKYFRISIFFFHWFEWYQYLALGHFLA